MYSPEQFVKLTNYDGFNRGFQYKEGLNEDIHELNREDVCESGGLYFCRFKHVCKWVNTYNNALIWKVEIPEREEVIEYPTKCKAKKIILRNPKKVYEDYKLCKLILQHNGYALEYVKEQTKELCKLAVQQNGMVLQFVKKQTEDLCKLAVQQNGLALKCVEEQTEELCKLAVRQNGMALKYVKEQTEEICMLAVRQNDFALQYVKNKPRDYVSLLSKKIV